MERHLVIVDDAEQLPQPELPRKPSRADAHHLPRFRSALAVCAHPDDEAFGLGSVLHEITMIGGQATLLCFTAGEMSTLGTATASGDLADRRRAELQAAAGELGVGLVQQLDHPDGALAKVPLHTLVAEVTAAARRVSADVLLVFDEGGVTGHPDHRRATQAAMAAATELPVLAWSIPRAVAELLNREFGTHFVGRDPDELDFTLHVDRGKQRRAIARHASQSMGNAVLWRRLELLGSMEVLRWLRRPTSAIRLSRDRTVRDRPFTYTVWIDDHEAGTIHDGEVTHYDVEPGLHHVQVGISGRMLGSGSFWTSPPMKVDVGLHGPSSLRCRPRSMVSLSAMSRHNRRLQLFSA